VLFLRTDTLFAVIMFALAVSGRQAIFCQIFLEYSRFVCFLLSACTINSVAKVFVCIVALLRHFDAILLT